MLDEYERRARVYPALLAALPLSLTAVVFGITSQEWWSAGAGVVVGSGLWGLAAQIGRHRGKKLELDLWRSWGGAPTTILLRHSDNPNPIHLRRLHERLAAMTGLRFPSANEESSDPVAADATYDAATKELINATRDQKRFALLFTENINYGYRRNVYGLKRSGIAACLMAAFLSVTVLVTDQPSFLDVEDSLGVTLILLDLLGAAAWWRLVTPDWVKQPAFAYAERLMEATTGLAE